MRYFTYIKYISLFTIFFHSLSSMGTACDKNIPEKSGFPIILNMVPKNKADSVLPVYLQKLENQANKGNPKSQVEIGELFETLGETPEDFTTAFNWYYKAARQNYMEAFPHVARCYREGIGVKEDPKKSLEYSQAYEFMEKHNKEFNWNKK